MEDPSNQVQLRPWPNETYEYDPTRNSYQHMLQS